MIKKAVIPAAGLGTRFLPYTKVYPKEMLPMIDKPSLSYLLEEIIDSGIEEVIIIINHDKTSIKEFYEENKKLEQYLKKRNDSLGLSKIKKPNVHIKYVYQKEQKGLGHAILQVEEYIKDEFFVCLLGDDIYDQTLGAVSQKMIRAHEQTRAPIIGVQQVEDFFLDRYGICITENNQEKIQKMSHMIEKPKEKVGSNLAALGRYVLPSSIFSYLRKIKSDCRGEIQLTDAIALMSQDIDIYTYEIENQRFDIGHAMGYLEAVIHFSLQRDDIKEDMKELIKKTYQKINR